MNLKELKERTSAFIHGDDYTLEFLKIITPALLIDMITRIEKLEKVAKAAMNREMANPTASVYVGGQCALAQNRHQLNLAVKKALDELEK